MKKRKERLRVSPQRDIVNLSDAKYNNKNRRNSMEGKEWRGQNKVEEGKKKKKDVFDFYKAFPDASQIKCQKMTGISLKTISKYRKMFFNQQGGK